MSLAPLALMLASGFAGLGYQIVWTQQSSVWLGHESAAVLAVVTAFFGGLALGAAVFAPRIERSAHPARWYAGCELAIAAWGGVLALLIGPAGGWLLGLTGVQPTPAWQWTVAFCGTFVLLLPATAAMGATLPAMERVTAQLRGQGRSIAALYAGNTAGAVLGVLATAFWLVPAFGLVRTAFVCIGLNLLCAAVALAALPRTVPAPAAVPAMPAPAGRTALVRLALTGLLGIGYEVLVVRVLSQVTEDTVYTFAMLLAVYLVGSAAGAALYQRWHGERADAQRLCDRLLCLLALACLLGTGALFASEAVKGGLLAAFGAGMGAAVAAEAALALFAFGPATVVMGALFSHLGASACAAGVPFGRSLAVNTLGAAAAPLLFGVLLVPALGAKAVLLLIAAAYLALTARRAWLRPPVLLPLAAGGAMALWAPPLAFVDVPEGGRLLSYREGAMAAVSVVEDADGVARLRINNRQQEGSSATRLVDARQALLPLLLHPAPRQALFLGLGTGVTATSAALDPALQVDAVELLPEVIKASPHFTRALTAGLPAPRLDILAADARRYVRASERHYDVIVSDNFHPARSGSGALYTVEHFGAVRERLAAGGVFCQWLPLHQLDLATLRSIVKSFQAVYPGGWAMLASNSLQTPVIGLVGKRDGSRFDVALLRQRLAGAGPPPGPAGFGIEDDLSLLGSFAAGPGALARFAGDAAANTDDHPVVAYSAPRVTYAPESRPADRLIALLAQWSITPAELIEGPTGAAVSERLAAYWAARNLFVTSGRDVRPAAAARARLAQVRDPLLSVLRTSPDFRPAYDPLLRMAESLARSDVAAARALLLALAQAQPARPEAAQVLQQLGAAAP